MNEGINMAQIIVKDLAKIDQKTSLHQPVDVDYSSYSINGQRYFQLKSYSLKAGRDSGHESQSFQFSRDNAVDFIKLLMKELNISAEDLYPSTRCII